MCLHPVWIRLDFYTRCYWCPSSLCKCQIRALYSSRVTMTAISFITMLQKMGDKRHLRWWPYQPCWNTAIRYNWSSQHSSCQSIERSIVWLFGSIAQLQIRNPSRLTATGCQCKTTTSPLLTAAVWGHANTCEQSSPVEVDSCKYQKMRKSKESVWTDL